MQDAHSQYEEGRKYYLDEGTPKDYQKAMNFFLMAAENGYACAQFYLGEMFYNGEGVRPSFYEAAKWYRLAAEQGHADARFALGRCYRSGIETTRKP